MNTPLLQDSRYNRIIIIIFSEGLRRSTVCRPGASTASATSVTPTTLRRNAHIRNNCVINQLLLGLFISVKMIIFIISNELWFGFDFLKRFLLEENKTTRKICFIRSDPEPVFFRLGSEFFFTSFGRDPVNLNPDPQI